MTHIAPHPGAPPALLKLTSPADVVAAVPYLVGFSPERSIVLLSLRGVRQRVGLTMRADLPPPSEAADTVAGLVGHLHRDGAGAAIAVMYAPEAVGGELWPVLRQALEQQGITIREALRVTDGRWWSYLCTAAECCPPGGTVILAPHEPGGPSRVGAELVSAGLAVLGSREELADSVRPADPEALAALAAILEPAARDVVRRVVQPGGLAGCRREWQRTMARVLGERRSQLPSAPLTEPEIAALLIALADIPTRDMAAEWAAGPDQAAAEQVQPLWLELTRRAPPPYDVAPATLLAHAAWYAGNGALARVAVERALRSDPSYRLARLIERLLDEAVNPDRARRSQRSGRRGRRR